MSKNNLHNASDEELAAELARRVDIAARGHGISSAMLWFSARDGDETYKATYTAYRWHGWHYCQGKGSTIAAAIAAISGPEHKIQEKIAQLQNELASVKRSVS